MFRPLINRVTDKEQKIKQIPAFLNRMSILIEEGYTFSDSIHILLPYHVQNVDYWKDMIEKQLHNGANAVDVLQSFSIPKHFLLAIQIAEENGQMAAALKNVSMEMAFTEKMQKRLGNLLAYPLTLTIFLAGIFIAFRTYFLPNIEQIIQTRTKDEHSRIAITKVFLNFPDYLLLLVISVLLIAAVFYLLLRKKTVQQQVTIFLKTPFVRYFYKLQLTRQLARFLGSLLSGGLSLQQALNILQQQQLNLHLSLVASRLENRIIYGDSLSLAVSLTPCFFSKFEDFIEHGEKSGYLGRELMIYSELLDEKLQKIVKTSLSVIQPLFFVIIALCIIVAYLSILLPIYGLIEII